jgi:hypothetical protein
MTSALPHPSLAIPLVPSIGRNEAYLRVDECALHIQQEAGQQGEHCINALAKPSVIEARNCPQSKDPPSTSRLRAAAPEYRRQTISEIGSRDLERSHKLLFFKGVTVNF